MNVLTGEVAEISPWLAAHQDVNAIDLAGAPGALADDLAVAAAGNLKRVVRFPTPTGPPSRALSACSPPWRPRRSGTR